MKKFLLAILITSFAFPIFAQPEKIIIIRHGDKDAEEESNHNLSKEGFSRALALPDVLIKKFKTFSAIFAPQPIPPKAKNIRSIQTITPAAIRLGININTSFRVGDEDKLAKELLTDSTLDGKAVLVVWEHKNIMRIIKELGVKEGPEKWGKNDYDSIFVITFNGNAPIISIDREGIK
jgi:hypothetical protein